MSKPIFVLASALVVAFAQAVLPACSASTKSAEQKILNVADIVCAIDKADPWLAPAEVDAAIQKYCGYSPDVHQIVDAQARAMARLTPRVLASASASAPAAAALAPPAASCPPVASASAAPLAPLATPSASAAPASKPKKK